MTTRIKAPKQARDGQDVAAEMVAESSVPHVQYTEAELQLAEAARTIAMDRDVLYHGTRYPKLVLETGALLRIFGEVQGVCLTRKPEVAAYWASLERDGDDGRGAIFVIDRRSLQRRYELVSTPQPFRMGNDWIHDEAEEVVEDDIVDLERHLIGYVRTLGNKGLRKGRRRRYTPNIRKRLRRGHRAQVEARFLRVCCAQLERVTQLQPSS